MRPRRRPKTRERWLLLPAGNAGPADSSEMNRHQPNVSCTLVDHRKTTAYFKLECGAPTEARHLVTDYDQLEHDRPTRNHLMGANRLFGQARCAARCGASGKHRNAPEKPICPTEGRVLLRCGGFARLIRCPTSHGDALIATAQNNPGQMTPYSPKLL